MFRSRFARVLLAVAFLLAAVSAIVLFGLYVLAALIALNVLAWALRPVAKRFGWGSEGRLARRWNRPPLLDERHSGPSQAGQV
jgi:hypothetical protein